MKYTPPGPDEVNERILDAIEIDEVIAARKLSSGYCHYCGADLMGGKRCPERCTAGDESPE